jgi:CubicO group peptidase (beta-lactamase class C family)
VSEWLSAALDYIPRWLEFQLRHLDQPGCAVAVARHGRIVFDEAFGVADLATGERLTPRHRFRIASHSKSFTAAGIMKLQEEGRLRIDDPVGKFVADLHPAIASVTLAQLLSHSAGVMRDGVDAGYFMDRQPFLTAPELLSGLAAPPTLETSLRFKYSNYGFGLLGLVIAVVTGEAYTSWISRAVIAPAGLDETAPDVETPPSSPFARGHSGRLPLGQRVVIPGENATQAMAGATGFVSTARDLALFFSQLDPASESRLLSPLSRREMTRRLWQDSESALERYYGLGLMVGKPGAWEWFGHLGMFQGYISGTYLFPRQAFAVSVLTNAIDGPAELWLGGIAHILETMAAGGAPGEKERGWGGRWWTIFGAMDLVPMGDAVRTAVPALFQPFEGGMSIALTDQYSGRLTRGSGFQGIGENVRLLHDSGGAPRELWFGGVKFLPEDALTREMTERYK